MNPFPQPLLLLLQEAHEAYLQANERIAVLDKRLQQVVKQESQGELLKTIPGVGAP